MEDLLGKALHTLRIEKGLSLRQAAEDVGISHTELRRIETGIRKNVAPAIVNSLAVRYGLTHVSPVIIDGKKYRIHELIRANHESENVHAETNDKFLTFSEDGPINIISSIIQEWLTPLGWDVKQDIPLNNRKRVDIYASNSATKEDWGMEVFTGYRFSRKRVSDIYFRLLTMQENFSKMSVVTNQPVIFNTFLDYPAINFSFLFSIILVDTKNNTIIEEHIIEPYQRPKF